VGCCSSPTWGEHGLAGAASRRGRKAGSSTEASGGEPPRIVTARVGGLELWPYAGNGAWWQPRRPSHLLFLSSSADRWCPLQSSTCRLRVSPPCTGGLRSHPVADASGAPVLRGQGPIGRPGPARPILPPTIPAVDRPMTMGNYPSSRVGAVGSVPASRTSPAAPSTSNSSET
jgi:hypothetical protein